MPVLLLTQALHVLGYGLFWVAMIQHVDEISPKEIATTSMLLVQTVYFNIASLLSSVGGGFFYRRYGGALLFRGTAIIVGAWAFVLMVYYPLRLRNLNLDVNGQKVYRKIGYEKIAQDD